jgi:hypothetical protein
VIYFVEGFDLVHLDDEWPIFIDVQVFPVPFPVLDLLNFLFAVLDVLKYVGERAFPLAKTSLAAWYDF